MGEDARLQTIVGLAQAIAAADTPEEVARAAARAVRAAMDGSYSAVSVWERERGRLRVLGRDDAGARVPDGGPDDRPEEYPVLDFPELAQALYERWARGGGPLAWVQAAEHTHSEYTRSERTRSERPDSGAYARRRAARLHRQGRGSSVIAPVVLHGRPWGELYVARDADRPVFGHDDAELATVLAAVTAAGIAQHERLAEVRRLAFTDPLTGLANRRAVDARLDEALERHRADGAVVTLVICDINGLKRVNDVYGHPAGDRLLERFGALLSGCGSLLSDTLAARLGGDEFCLLAVGPPAEEVIRVADEVCHRAGGLALGEGVACGVASTGDPVGEVGSARRLFRLADAAQYRAKAARSAKPEVAGRYGGAQDPVVRLADSAEEGPERRRFRGRQP